MSNPIYTTRTDGQSKTDTITWTVLNYSELVNQQVSQIISFEDSDSSDKFQLKLQFPSQKKDVCEFYYISTKPVYLKCQLTISLTNHSIPIDIKKDGHIVQPYKWEYLGTVNRNSINKNMGGAIKCEFTYNIIMNDTFHHMDIPESSLFDEFENLLNSELYSDAIMKSSDGIEFKVHKGLLASRCAVLKAHFEHNTTECTTNIIESPFDAEVLQEVLIYLYCDKTPRVAEIPDKLLAAADYHQLNRLKLLCQKQIQKNLNIENAIETLQLADLYSADNLKQATLAFIKTSQTSLIMKTKGWSNLTSVELLKNIMQYLVAVNDDEYCKKEL